MAGMKEMLEAASPREFTIETSMTLEEAYEKLAARASAFQMPFEIKGGIGGDRIVFKKEPKLDVELFVFVDGTNIKVQPNVREKAQVSVGGFNVNQNIGDLANLPLKRGEYMDAVTDTIKKIWAGEPVPDYTAPAAPQPAPAASPAAADTGAAAPTGQKSWTVALILVLLLGGIGAHRFYVGKIGTGIVWLLTCGLFGIGSIYDLIMIIMNKFTDKDGNLLAKN